MTWQDKWATDRYYLSYLALSPRAIDILNIFMSFRTAASPSTIPAALHQRWSGAWTVDRKPDLHGVQRQMTDAEQFVPEEKHPIEFVSMNFTAFLRQHAELQTLEDGPF